MKTDNWLLRESTTRVTDNRAEWREEYERHLENKDASTLGEYLHDKDASPYDPIRWSEIRSRFVEVLFYVCCFLLLYYIIFLCTRL